MKGHDKLQSPGSGSEKSSDWKKRLGVALAGSTLLLTGCAASAKDCEAPKPAPVTSTAEAVNSNSDILKLTPDQLATVSQTARETALSWLDGVQSESSLYDSSEGVLNVLSEIRSSDHDGGELSDGTTYDRIDFRDQFSAGYQKTKDGGVEITVNTKRYKLYYNKGELLEGGKAAELNDERTLVFRSDNSEIVEDGQIYEDEVRSFLGQEGASLIRASYRYSGEYNGRPEISIEGGVVSGSSSGSPFSSAKSAEKGLQGLVNR